MIEIRQVGPEDLNVLSNLLEQCASELTNLRGGEALRVAIERPWLDATALVERSTHSEVFVLGAQDDDLVGLCIGWVNDAVGWIGLYVSPSHRRNGVAKKLLATAISELTALGIHVFDALATPGDRAMKSLFEAHGFKARLLVMRRES